jgi:4-amino-4-deoxy-L-arabinose transferase-like glycosyltransferase
MGDAPTDAGRPGDLPGHARGAIVAITLLTLVLAASWATSLDAPLGDNHEGRVDARFALHVQNLRAEGWSDSSYGASMEPYGGAYAHHPPGPVAAQWLASWLPGRGDHEVRLFPFAMGLLTVPAAAWLLRALGLRWPSVVAATAVLVSTPLFWTYGRLLWDHPLLFAVPAALLSYPPKPTRRRAASTALLVVVAVLMSWIAGAFAAAFLAVVVARRRVALGELIPLACAWLAGIAVVGIWILAASSSDEITDQIGFRTTGGSFTAGDWLERQLTWASDLLPLWLLPLVLAGLWAARRRREVRAPLAVAAALGALFVAGLPNGSFIHDYWTYPLLVALTMCAALTVELWLPRASDRAQRLFIPAGAAVGSVLVALLALGPFGRSHFEDREDAGRLAQRTAPFVRQDHAWTVNGVDTPRWLSLYWGIPARVLDADLLRTAPGDDLVLAQLPLPSGFERIDIVEREGDYVLVTAGDLRRACDATGGCRG